MRHASLGKTAGKQPKVALSIVFLVPTNNKHNARRAVHEINQQTAKKKLTMVETYKAVFVRFMSCLHDDHERDKGCNFSQEELGVSTPIDVQKHMCCRACGMPEPGLEDHPVHVRADLHVRANLLAFWKKAISHFMPKELKTWNALAQVGDRTKSIEVTELIKAVKKSQA
jgi:hypothetical protein